MAKDQFTSYIPTSRYDTTSLCRTASNPLECRGNYSATLNNMKLLDWPLTGGLLHLLQRGGAAAPQAPPRSTAVVPITVLLYNGPLLRGFNVLIKG